MRTQLLRFCLLGCFVAAPACAVEDGSELAADEAAATMEIYYPRRPSGTINNFEATLSRQGNAMKMTITNHNPFRATTWASVSARCEHLTRKTRSATIKLYYQESRTLTTEPCEVLVGPRDDQGHGVVSPQ